MLNIQNSWPFGLDRTKFPRFALLVLAIFVMLVFLDAPVTRFVAQLPEAVRSTFRIITRAGTSDWILIPTLAVAVLGFLLGKFLLAPPRNQKIFTVTSVSFFIFAGVALPGIGSNLIKRAVGRARPVNFEEFGIFHFEPVLNDWSFQSFPSGDTTTIFALAIVIMFFLPRAAAWVLAGAALVGLSRIMVGVHFPTDVFGGILTGTFGAFAVRNYCARQGWLFRRTDEGKYIPDLHRPSAADETHK